MRNANYNIRVRLQVPLRSPTRLDNPIRSEVDSTRWKRVTCVRSRVVNKNLQLSRRSYAHEKKWLFDVR